MDLVYPDIPRIYTAIAEWGACMVYLLLIRKRFAKSKFVIGSMVALIVQSILLVATGGLPTIFWIPCMIAAVGGMYAFIYSMADIPALAAVYCCAKAFLLAEFVASLGWQLQIWFLADRNDVLWLQIPIMLIAYGVVFVVITWLEKPLLKQYYLEQISVKEVLPAVGIVIAIFSFSNLSFIYPDLLSTRQLQIDIFNLRTMVDLGGIAVLYAFQSRISEFIAEREVASIQSILRSQYDQYRNYQESLEMIQIKYHDLKHQIVGLRAESDEEKRKDWLDAMERELEMYEPVNKTGNKVLDTILAEKLFKCQKNHIQMTCVADGELLDFMHVTDICAIFGNALDNAIENTVMLEKVEKRMIHVSLSKQRQFTLIKIENYCESELDIGKNKIPITTKIDKKNHGYGLQSIIYATEKYNGSVSFDIRNNWFELIVLFP